MSITNFVKLIIPSPLKKGVRRFLGINNLVEQISILNEKFIELEQTINQKIKDLEYIVFGGNMWDRSRIRWMNSSPDEGLTWQINLTGDAFVNKLREYIDFSEEKSILDLGPGYGRIFKSIVNLNVPFKSYTGLDISIKSVDFLNSNFGAKSVNFVIGDMEAVILENNYDIVVSSLTFKHLFPTFKKTLLNISKYLNKNSVIAFDLIEGDSWGVEKLSDTYIKKYTKHEVEAILREIGFGVVKFDIVSHAPGFDRLLVIAKKNF